jgi:hypothetical protein
MFTYRIMVESETLQKALQRSPAALFSLVQRSLKEVLNETLNDVKVNRATGGTTATRLRVRSGRLRNALNYRVTGTTLDTLVGELGASSIAPYAKVQELGTVGKGGSLPDIVPTHGKYLAIPLPAAMTPAGVPRGTPRNGPWGATFIRKGVIFGFTTVGQHGKANLVPLFALKRKVAILPRLGLRWTLEKHLPDLVSRINKGMSSILSGENG